jgi:hypothetical protein
MGGTANGPTVAPAEVPHLAAATAALGAAMLSREAAVGLVAKLPREAFADDCEGCGVVYDALAALVADEEAVDQVTVTAWLADGDRLDVVGGAGAVADLADACAAPSAWRSYLLSVERAWLRRREEAGYLSAVGRLRAGVDLQTVRAGLPAPRVSDAGLQPVDWTTAWAGAATEAAWLVPGWLQAGRAAALVGAAKSGKSLLALEVAAALATGGRALGEDVGPVGVLYVDMENALEDVLGRLRDLGYGPDTNLDRLTYLTFPPLPPLDTEAGGAALAAAARDTGAELVVLDTLSRLISGDENDSRTVLDWYRHAVVPLRRDAVALLAIDHLGKDPARGARGTSAKADAVDVVWQAAPRGGHLLALTATHRRQLGYHDLLLHRRTEPAAPASRGWCATPTQDRSSPRCATANGSPSSEPSPRSVRSVTATTRARRGRQLAVQDRADPRAWPGPLEERRRRRARHPRLGQLVQHHPPAQHPGRRPARRVRSRIPSPNGDQPPGWNPLSRVSIEPRAVQAAAGEFLVDAGGVLPGSVRARRNCTSSGSGGGTAGAGRP